MKKILSVTGVFLTVLSGLAFASPASAATTTATHNTVATAASTSVATNAVPASGFKPMTGNYYGNQVHVWSLTYDGRPVRTTTLTGWCLLAVAGGLGLVFFPPTTAIAWAYEGSVAAASLVPCFIA
jgi:hypothetical protein